MQNLLVFYPIVLSSSMQGASEPLSYMGQGDEAGLHEFPQFSICE